MSAKTDPRCGISYGWTLGDSGWNTGMDANLLWLARFGSQLSAKNRTTTAPPASPADGDTYLVAASATGAWAGKDGQIAVWDAQATTPAWAFGVPRAGWRCVIEAESKITTYLAGVWTAGVAV